ncbi:MAG: phytanoyl-CoA dioxygenase family protein [bacterium]|jgi:ectoine hydroxylase-related dioxygenase (phytanoyl-CoA dioxygenase family)|nr:phytanoyl-CoA dioxygenase family protein [bacterium]
MNEYEKFFFDLWGYLVVENALTREEVEACNKAIDNNLDQMRVRSSEQSLSGASMALKGKHGRGDLGGMLTWPRPHCQPFRNLLAHPIIIPYLAELLREDYRLDHLYGIVMEKGAEGHTLHGGGTADDLTHFYQFHNGRMRCGLTVVSFVLTDCNPGDGGFACIPGSHKSNYKTPRDVALLDKNIGVVQQVSARAGSAIIFTEALTHGTLPWTADHPRRSILYKYAPGPLTYSSQYLPPHVAEVLDEFTPAQRALLEPPYRPNRPRVTQPNAV